ncbi:CBK_G0011420.mRNA.1.CDS.1 [Saccharomyces cerevisiae]|nr:CBK_G0011420.mRNA.1.CDS.1 [Saccharomyces cerevisiae]CAI7215027.1 CBK_G0011420.mRNA.1.CDS.1 [Saccharomyces cerevisiae]
MIKLSTIILQKFRKVRRKAQKAKINADSKIDVMIENLGKWRVKLTRTTGYAGRRSEMFPTSSRVFNYEFHTISLSKRTMGWSANASIEFDSHKIPPKVKNTGESA